MADLVGVVAASLTAAAPLPLHGASPNAPVPGWLVLVGGVVALWLVVTLGVEVTDRLFDALEAP